MKNELFSNCEACCGTGMLDGQNCAHCELQNGISLGFVLTAKGTLLWLFLEKFEEYKAKKSVKGKE